MQSTLSLPLQSLPLRPSTLTALLRSGFSTTGDVTNSCHSEMLTTTANDNGSGTNDGDANVNNGLGQFAKDLGCDASQAADYAHEIDDALGSVGLPKMLAPSTQNQISGQRNDDATNNYHEGEVMAPYSAYPATAASILQDRANSISQAPRQIVSFCKPLDMLLGGGFALSELTEIVGLPGVGKTQLAMQICVDTRLPSDIGGVGGHAVVIDAEGSWSGAAGGDRLWSMAVALCSHVQNGAKRKLAAAKGKRPNDLTEDEVNSLYQSDSWLTPEKILEGIHIFRVHDEASQTCTLYNLPKFLLEQEEKNTPVKLVVIDSLAFHYRVASSSSMTGTSTAKNNSLSTTHNLTRMSAFLTEMATEFDLAVVAMNHLTTRIEKDDKNNPGGTTKLVPALGESWAHSITSRLMIDHYRQSGEPRLAEARVCTLVKSPHKPTGTAVLMITNKGIRGVEPELLKPQEATKRARVE